MVLSFDAGTDLESSKWVLTFKSNAQNKSSAKLITEPTQITLSTYQSWNF